MSLIQKQLNEHIIAKTCNADNPEYRNLMTIRSMEWLREQANSL